MLESLVKLALTPVTVTAAFTADVIKTATGNVGHNETPLDTTVKSIARTVDTLEEVAKGGSK